MKTKESWIFAIIKKTTKMVIPDVDLIFQAFQLRIKVYQNNNKRNPQQQNKRKLSYIKMKHN